MAQYNSIDKKAVKALNQKQTVLIETVVEKGKTSKNVYLNNSRKRSEAYYGIYVAEEGRGPEELSASETLQVHRGNRQCRR